ncbi:cation:proton antiporter [Arthrobacter sp. ISL-65]|uniref:cation:proton antiporter domain-containing protein n=1 Tax=Arthrobacter sp. ISL-65 TaxID=2819112 RepID=UPI002035B66B|nr:cation:proton antiporter [Arthrobacter sp. ISL-65]
MTAWVGMQIHRRLEDRLLANVVSILTPFTAFLLAETVRASGVLAVVVAGLFMSQIGPRVIRAGARRQGESFWSLTAFLLNGALFVLVGLELPSAVRGLSSVGLATGLLAVAAVSAVVVGIRFLFLFVTTYAIRLIGRRPEQRLRRVSNRARVVSGVAGFRGAVSLAAALAVPEILASGALFPGRDMIIFVTSGVIVVTLVIQGPLLPAVVRWARLPHDKSVDEERQLAETTATEEALTALPGLADDLGADQEATDGTHAGAAHALRNRTRD